MAIVGWCLLVLMLGGVSVLWAVLAFNYLGTFNFGGVPNSWQKQLGYLAVGGDFRLPLGFPLRRCPIHDNVKVTDKHD